MSAETPDELLKYLCPLDGLPDPLSVAPSPYAEPFAAELLIPPIKQPVAALNPSADPRAHQLFDKHAPKKFYEIREQEFQWQYHPHGPYANGTLGWGFDYMTPGPTFMARYGEPVLVRMINDLPPVGSSKVTFALPSTTTHLHNGHTASESDGNPQDWIDSGEFWDHHYGNFPSGGDLDALDEHGQDIGDENADPNRFPSNWRLPSGKYDIPLIFHDVQFDQGGQVVFNNFFTDGWLGDQVTVNRRIRPRLTVERRKYRFRILNGGPSRFYQFGLSGDEFGRSKAGPFYVLTGDGNFLPEAVRSSGLLMSVAQRTDVTTQVLRQMLRVFGTAKPRVGIVSKFYGAGRVEDARLREHVLSMSLPDQAAAGGDLGLRLGSELPAWFSSLLVQDAAVQKLWLGQDKPEGLDTSASGYDHSLIRRLLNMGHTDVAELATVLALRPGGSAVKHGKGDAYIRRTIASALTK